MKKKVKNVVVSILLVTLLATNMNMSYASGQPDETDLLQNLNEISVSQNDTSVSQNDIGITPETEATTDPETEHATEEPFYQELTYEDSDVKVVVSAEQEGVIPEGATLSVVPILPDEEDTREQYAQVEQQLHEKAEGEEYDIAGFLAYDISFIDKEGNKIEPAGAVKVSMEYIKAAIPEEVAEKVENEEVENVEVTVMHLAEDNNGNVQEVVDLLQATGDATENKIETLEVNEAREIEKAEFVTESFSVFTVTWTANGKDTNNGDVDLKADKVMTVHVVDINGKDILHDVTAEFSYNVNHQDVSADIIENYIKQNGFKDTGYLRGGLYVIENGEKVYVAQVSFDYDEGAWRCLEYGSAGPWRDWRPAAVGNYDTNAELGGEIGDSRDIYLEYYNPGEFGELKVHIVDEKGNPLIGSTVNLEDVSYPVLIGYMDDKTAEQIEDILLTSGSGFKDGFKLSEQYELKEMRASQASGELIDLVRYNPKEDSNKEDSNKEDWDYHRNGEWQTWTNATDVYEIYLVYELVGAPLDVYVMDTTTGQKLSVHEIRVVARETEMDDHDNNKVIHDNGDYNAVLSVLKENGVTFNGFRPERLEVTIGDSKQTISKISYTAGGDWAYCIPESTEWRYDVEKDFRPQVYLCGDVTAIAAPMDVHVGYMVDGTFHYLPTVGDKSIQMWVQPLKNSGEVLLDGALYDNAGYNRDDDDDIRKKLLEYGVELNGFEPKDKYEKESGATIVQMRLGSPTGVLVEQISYNPNQDEDDDDWWFYNSDGGWKEWKWNTASDGTVERPQLYIIYEDLKYATVDVHVVDAEGHSLLGVENSKDKTLPVKIEKPNDEKRGTIDDAIYDIANADRLKEHLSNELKDVTGDYTLVGMQIDTFYKAYKESGVRPNNEGNNSKWVQQISYSPDDGTTWNYNADGWKVWNVTPNTTPQVYLVYDEVEELKTIETLDSKAAGITMRMIDYSSPGQDLLKEDRDGKIVSFGGGYNSGSTWNGNIKSGIVSRVLDSGGYPVSENITNDNGVANISLEPLFSLLENDESYVNVVNASRVDSSYEVNHLFSKQLFEKTGYYEYSSFKNYAYLDTSKKNSDGVVDFTVYDHIGTPVNENKYYFQRGNFMPYNAIVADDISTNSNWYNGDGSLKEENKILTDEEKALFERPYGERLYKTQGTNNYWFGMYLETGFYQPENGQVENLSTVDAQDTEDMVYKFNGDDDLWIYVDDVLLLDIGGIHDAHEGEINFATGEIRWSDCKTGENPINYYTTIGEQYKEAGVFPDGSAWDDSKISDYFKKVVDDNGKEKYTFKDHTTHTMKMFYMERGAGASNLHLRFNLKVVPIQDVEVTKMLEGDTENRYKDTEQYAFQLLAQELVDITKSSYEFADESYVPLGIESLAIYKDDNNDETKSTAITFYDNVTIEGKEYDNVFYLKAGETAVFKNIPAHRKYQVVELGLDTTKYAPPVFTDGKGQKITVSDDSSQNEIKVFKSNKENVGSRNSVIVTNKVLTDNLKITKKMKSGQMAGADDTFTFKVWIENAEEVLVPYVGSYYIQGNDGTAESKQTTSDGSISGVKVDDIITIKGILNGTRFYVEEVLPPDSKYATMDITADDSITTEMNISRNGEKDEEGNLIVDSVSVIPNGAIQKNANVLITVTNKYKTSVDVTKVWDDMDKNHTGTAIYVGLYVKTSGTDEEGNSTETVEAVNEKFAALNSENNWSCTFDYLPELTNNQSYVVKELRPVKTAENEVAEFTIDNAGYIGVDESATTTVAVDGENIGYKVTYNSEVQEDETAGVVENFTIKNLALWQIVKENDNGERLPDAEFKLIRTSDQLEIYGVSGNKDPGKGVITWRKNIDGEEIATIPSGIYTFREVAAPGGYMLSDVEWTIKISENGVPESVQYASGKNKGDNISAEIIDGVLTFTYTNSQMYTLPNTGGVGVFFYAGAGLLLLFAALLLTYKSKHEGMLD